LNIEDVLAGTDKGFHLQVLFQGLEEKLDLPAVLVYRRNSSDSESEVIGQQHDFLFIDRPVGWGFSAGSSRAPKAVFISPSSSDKIISSVNDLYLHVPGLNVYT
jgi:hypothetical protein